ncbi:TetR/AcrR family transcriptional regulator [Pseudahrensia aquimaris]|uniref:TetR/AcrR family transcriptional regulator n=1 Tax=Pseudahrensia aquimaris TaxID=744461 RepID=A0ABW3FLE6_9HYPH
MTVTYGSLMKKEARTIRQDKRKRQILGATLRLIRRHGTGISTAQIAAEAKCSKETLYAWFNDRDGIMRALVEEQARSMGLALNKTYASVEGSGFRTRLRAYCLALIDILTGEAVLAVNRVAMADACHQKNDLGALAIADWQAQVAAPLVALLKEGAAQGDVTFDDADEAFDILIGLLIGDRQRRLLLGEASRPDAAQMEQIVDTALTRWLRLCAPR